MPRWQIVVTGRRSKLSFATVAALAGLAATDARADAVDDLVPGTWYEVPDSNMRQVCPPDTAEYDWSFFCSSAIGAWSGGVMDTARGRLIVWGGGHADYKGNDVYAFDMASLAWERIWGPTPDAQIPNRGANEVYDDGNPGSRHTYSGLVYMPPPQDRMISSGGSLWQSGAYGSGVWSYAFDDDAWTRMADGPGQMGFGDPMVFDPETGRVFRRANSRMFEYDVDADTFTGRAESDGGFWATNVSSALDLSTRTMVIMGEERVDLYHLDTDTYEQGVTVDGANVIGGNSPGVAYDSQLGRIVVWTGGQNVYTFDVQTRAFAEHTAMGADPGPITPSGGAFGRFRYSPSRNVFVYVDGVDTNVFVLRMSEGQGVPPEPPEPGDDTGDSGDSGIGNTGDELTGDDDGPGDETTGGVSVSAGDEMPSDAGAVDGTAANADTGDGGQAGDDTASGCSCHADAPTSGGIAWMLLGLPALGFRARRRRHV